MNRSGAWRAVRGAVLGGLVLVAAIQLVPYGWGHPNPPVTQNAPWPDSQSERIARSSCYHCHSNETDWDRDDGDADKAIEEILDGSMPPDRYTMIHRGARLTDAEADRLVAALRVLDEEPREGNEDAGGGGDGDGRGGDDEDGDA